MKVIRRRGADKGRIMSDRRGISRKYDQRLGLGMRVIRERDRLIKGRLIEDSEGKRHRDDINGLELIRPDYMRYTKIQYSNKIPIVKQILY